MVEVDRDQRFVANLQDAFEAIVLRLAKRRVDFLDRRIGIQLGRQIDIVVIGRLGRRRGLLLEELYHRLG